MFSDETRVVVIAEAGVNHDGCIDTATELVDAAVESGADAVKFQTFRASQLVCRDAPKAEYQNETTSDCESQLEMLERLELSEQGHLKLIAHAQKRGIRFLSTAFDATSLDLLTATFALPVLKLGSGEVTNAPLLLRAAASGCDVILSTGMSTLGEVETALGVLAFGYTRRDEQPCAEAFVDAFRLPEGQAALRRAVTLLHCTSEYPAPVDEVNLRCLKTMARAFGLRVGLSDHTQGIAVPIAAAAIGARAIEKHFTLSRKRSGPDHAASLEPDELSQMVRGIRQVEVALGTPEKRPAPSELANRQVVRRSLVAARSIRRGTRITEQDIGVKRPAGHVPPIRYWEYVGRVAERDYAPDEPLDP